MTRTITNAVTTSRKFGFAVLAAGVLTITSGIAAPQQAKAFGLGDVFDAVEDVWEIGADATERVGRKIGKEARKIGRGTITPTRPNGRRGVSGTPVGGGNSALPPARRPVNSSVLPPARGTAKPTGDRALPPPRKANQRPRPITENDVRPPICNSKFENCSGNGGHGHDGHDGHHDHHGKKGKRSKTAKKWKKNNSRDKSVWGNPVGNGKKAQNNKRSDRKLRIKRQDKKVQIKIQNNKRSSRSLRISNRRG